MSNDRQNIISPTNIFIFGVLKFSYLICTRTSIIELPLELLQTVAIESSVLSYILNLFEFISNEYEEDNINIRIRFRF